MIGNLTLITSPPDFIKSALRFWRCYNEEIEGEYFDEQTQQMKKFKRRSNRVKGYYENLHTQQGDDIVTYTGLLPRIVSLFEKNSFPFSIHHKQSFVQPTINPVIAQGLRADQIECLSHLLATTHGTVHATTSYGKTYVIQALIKAFPNSKIVVSTYRQSVVKRLHDGLSEFIKEEQIGLNFGGCSVKKRITVCSIGTLDDFADNEVDVLIVDESHEVLGDVSVTSLFKLVSCRRYAFSGTLKKRFDGKNLLHEALFGPIVFTMMDREAEEKGFICPVQAYMIEVKGGPNLSRKKSDLAIERNGIWYNPFRNRAIKEVADRLPPDQQTIIFVRTKYHMDHLKEHYLKDWEIFHAGLSTSEKRQLQSGFEKGEIKRLISTSALSTGVDPANLFVVIDASWETSERSLIQKAGRNRRFGKDDKPYGVLINFMDMCDKKVLERSKKRLAEYVERGYKVISSAARPQDIVFVNKNQHNDQNVLEDQK